MINDGTKLKYDWNEKVPFHFSLISQQIKRNNNRKAVYNLFLIRWQIFCYFNKKQLQTRKISPTKYVGNSFRCPGMINFFNLRFTLFLFAFYETY